MKRAIFTLFAILLVFACTAQKETTIRNGIRVLGTTEINAIPESSRLLVLDNEGLGANISLANLISQLNLATGNLTQEEIEDIVGPMLVSGSSDGATFTYNDANGTIEVNITGGTDDTNDYPTAATLSDNILAIEIANQENIEVDLSALRVDISNTVKASENSPTQNIDFWIGTKKEFKDLAPTAKFIVVTDSIPNSAGTISLPELVDEDRTNDVVAAPDSPTQDIDFWIGTKQEHKDLTPTAKFQIITDSIPNNIGGGGTVLQGEKGDTGETGPQGLPGADGAQGIQGEKGDTGETGPQGLPGADGAQGIQGEKGDTGNVGPQGIQGLPGADGADGTSAIQSGNFTPSLIDNNTNTFTVNSSSSNYYRVGDLVFVTILISNINTVGTPSGGLRISGMPFPIANFNRGSFTLNLWDNLSTDVYSLYFSSTSTDTISIYFKSSSQGSIGGVPLSSYNLSGRIYMTGIYVTN